LTPLREVIARHGIVARKRLGQNFLLDLNLTGRIARAAGRLDQATVIEIGPGPGGLTRALLASGARRVVAIERDRRCLAALAELAAACPGRLDVIAGDALELDPAMFSEKPRKIVANLPYNIATPLLLGWLGRVEEYESLTLMLQREVAERLIALPRSKSYGRLSVLVQWLAEARILFDVPARAFMPPPRVTSSVVAGQTGCSSVPASPRRHAPRSSPSPNSARSRAPWRASYRRGAQPCSGVIRRDRRFRALSSSWTDTSGPAIRCSSSLRHDTIR